MSTYVLGIVTPAYSLITNRIRASIATQASPLAIVASIIDTTVGHPERTYSFAGLPRDNYNVSVDEIDGSGNVVANKAYFSVVPSNVSGELSRDDEQLTPGVTPGFTVGANNFIFDGTSGTQDYRGWNIVPSELTGRGILVLGLDYTWDMSAGRLGLLQTGDVFQTGVIWNIHFDCQNQTAGNSAPASNDLVIMVITADTTLDTGDFGKKIICEPAGNNILITLPDASSIPDGRIAYVEGGGSGIRHAKFVPQGSDTIAFLNGGLYCYSNESFSIYKFTRSVGVYEFRVFNDSGNFKTVGNIISADQVSAGIVNSQLLDGSAKDKYQYARIYEQVVLMLPGAQVVNYDDWATGNNKKYFSLANSADPSNADKFHFPDRSGLYERATSAGKKAGDYLSNDNKEHGHSIDTTSGITSSNTTADPVRGTLLGSPNAQGSEWVSGADNKTIKKSGGTEARPETVYTNKYVLI